MLILKIKIQFLTVKIWCVSPFAKINTMQIAKSTNLNRFLANCVLYKKSAKIKFCSGCEDYMHRHAMYNACLFLTSFLDTERHEVFCEHVCAERV